VAGNLSRSRAQRLIEQGQVTVEGRRRPASYALRGGQVVRWTVPPPQPTALVPDRSVDFELVYEDDDLAVVDKPAGLVVHPAPGHATGTLVQGLMARLTTLSDVGGRARPGLVHRLDKDTSGLLVVAKRDDVHQALQDQLRRREMKREYRALCWGRLEPGEGRIELPLDRHPRDRKRRAVRPTGRLAVTDYETLERFAGASLLAVRLLTGRTHQIRVHLAHVGHPVLGDTVYGGGASRLRGAAPEHRPALQRALAALGRQALHAGRLAFTHPASGEVLIFSSPLPADFVAARDLLAAKGVDSPADGR
jgi:23S rRNA pseudouridine1911/1915/1917 synthase